MGTLFLVSTPIGNIEDITLRALRVLFTTRFIACEDTRRISLLLTLLNEKYSSSLPQETIEHTYIRYDDVKEITQTPEILELLQSGNDVALVTDAGTPLVADPGYRIMEACIKRNIPVVVVPGATASITALTASGYPGDKFLFLGYLPEKQKARETILKHIKDIYNTKSTIRPTILFYCAPHKLETTLADMRDNFGDISIVVARELTKIHEEIFRGTISDALQKYSNPKGEFVILFRFV